MRKVRFITLVLFALNGQLMAQSYKEQYEKCAELLGSLDTGDTAYWRLIKHVFNCMKGANAPDFNIKTLEGKTLSLSELKGHVVVINFWNTQCRPCIAEIPALNEIVAMYKGQNVTFISATYESEQKARDFISKHSFQFQNAGDAEKIIVDEFLTNDIYPYSMIIDKQGKISKVMIGGSLEKEETFQQFLPSINECLAKND